MSRSNIRKGVLLFVICIGYALPAISWVWNNPYPASQSSKKIYYTSFAEQPKTLDPAKSYDASGYQFIAQIYEPVLQFDYLVRPYKLIPLLAASMPEVRYYNKSGQEVSDRSSSTIVKSVYTIRIKQGLLYQPHPALAQTREVKADDFIYQIKRMANPANNSPIYGLMSQYILGFQDYGSTLPKSDFIDLRQYPLLGLNLVDDYTFEIRLNGQYTQFMFWLGMLFFCPIPWEVDQYYAKPGMQEQNIGFDWHPVGTGPFLMSQNNPNRQIVLDKNPNFRQDFFPAGKIDSPIEDQKYIHHSGERLPLLDKVIYTLEKESIPRWSKFLQGYYDASGVTADSFDQAIKVDASDVPFLTPSMREKGLRLEHTIDPSIYYLGFNMRDAVVGGTSERARKLRQAISIAVDYEEYITIFLNGRGQAAQGPLPPSIFGHLTDEMGINPYVYQWDGHAPKRRSIQYAQTLMRRAGYPGGRDPKTGRSLILHYDVATTGGPDDKAQLDWMRKQFARLGIDLNIRATLYNRFQEKMRMGNAQIFKWAWSADYPDPENFLFLFYGPHGEVKFGGENTSNYLNKRYDRLFDLMKNRSNDAVREQLIRKMVALLRHDAPWIWGYHSETLTLSQQWVSPVKPSTMSYNTLKYEAIDVSKRASLRQLWNRAVLWPIVIIFCLLLLTLLPFLLSYRKKQRRHAPRQSL